MKHGDMSFDESFIKCKLFTFFRNCVTLKINFICVNFMSSKKIYNRFSYIANNFTSH